MKLRSYFKEAFNELFYKVSWPTRSELQSSTIIVMVASFIIAIMVFAMDIMFRYLMQAIYSMFY